jgi:hypothetical protein
MARALGGTRAGAVVTDDAGSSQVVHHPEGDEFCFVRD